MTDEVDSYLRSYTLPVDLRRGDSERSSGVDFILKESGRDNESSSRRSSIDNSQYTYTSQGTGIMPD
jgi:hypothetical protein